MRAEDVLTIDVDAEIREICREQLQGDWQIPAELIRYALPRGGAEISVRRRRHGFFLKATGVICRDGELGHAATALDQAMPADVRHRSIAALERAGANALLWAGGAEGARLRVANRVGGAATVLEVRPGRSPILEENAVDEVPGGFEVLFSASGFDARQALDWLPTACRFAPVVISVGGRPLPQGFGPALRSVSLGRPLPGGIALTARGDAPHLWLVRHGVLSSRATLPGYPPFEAVTELGELTREGTAPDDLRRALHPFLPPLLDRVGDLILDAVREARLDDPEEVERTCTLGLRAIRSGLARDRLEAAPLVPAFTTAGGTPTRLSVAELRRICDGRRSPLYFLSRQPRRPWSGGWPLLLLTAEQHTLLSEVLPLRIERPEPRRRRQWRRVVASGVSAASARIQSRLSSMLGTKVLDEGELIDVERGLIRRLRGAVVDDEGRPLQVRMVAGVGRVRRRRGALLIPRNNSLVTRCVRLVAAEDEWLYPAMLALIGDELAAPVPVLRERWLAGTNAGRPAGAHGTL